MLDNADLGNKNQPEGVSQKTKRERKVNNTDAKCTM